MDQPTRSSPTSPHEFTGTYISCPLMVTWTALGMSGVSYFPVLPCDFSASRSSDLKRAQIP